MMLPFLCIMYLIFDAKKSKENGMSWKKLKDILPTRGEIYYMPTISP
jgi:hypothetical protein